MIQRPKQLSSGVVYSKDEVNDYIDKMEVYATYLEGRLASADKLSDATNGYCRGPHPIDAFEIMAEANEDYRRKYRGK